MRLIAIFNLKPGVSVAEYEAWARGTDLPTVNALPSVSSFRVFKTTGKLGLQEAAPYSYIEIIDIDDMDQFWKDVATDTMSKIAEAFGSMADVTFMTTEEIKV
jgi:hypothetical protein